MTYGLCFSTSRRGLLWPQGYWKCLIDALTAHGAKKNPVGCYGALTEHLPAPTRIGGRYHFKNKWAVTRHDDCCLSILKVHRVEEEEVGIACLEEDLPVVCSKRLLFEVKAKPFRTIGARKYELETRKHRNEIAHKLADVDRTLTELTVAFELSTDRTRPVDLDNLADALMVPFSKHFNQLNRITLYRLPDIDEPYERLRVCVS